MLIADFNIILQKCGRGASFPVFTRLQSKSKNLSTSSFVALVRILSRKIFGKILTGILVFLTNAQHFKGLSKRDTGKLLWNRGR